MICVPAKAPRGGLDAFTCCTCTARRAGAPAAHIQHQVQYTCAMRLQTPVLSSGPLISLHCGLITQMPARHQSRHKPVGVRDQPKRDLRKTVAACACTDSKGACAAPSLQLKYTHWQHKRDSSCDLVESVVGGSLLCTEHLCSTSNRWFVCREATMQGT
jgi:hypothetical protein